MSLRFVCVRIMRARNLRSSLIERIVFDEEAGTLAVKFRHAGRYVYSGVPRTICDALADAASAGRFFNEWIKGRYACHPDPATRRFRPE